jgi:hypothetical protein
MRHCTAHYLLLGLKDALTVFSVTIQVPVCWLISKWLCWLELGSSVTVVSGWATGLSRFDPRQRRQDSSCSLCVQTCSEVHPASCTMGAGGPFRGAKARTGRDADHSHPSSRERVGAIPPLPPSASVACSGRALALLIMVVCLQKS